MTNLNATLNKIQLGLCDPPEPIYLYVGQTENNGDTSLWHQYDIDAQKQCPVKQRGLTGYISELRITVKEFKGRENNKLDVVIHAEQVYIVRSGLETNFSKTLLLALSTLPDLKQPVTIAVVAGQENVVFARVYNATTKVRCKAEWNPDANWFDLISQIQQRLGVTKTQDKIGQPLTTCFSMEPRDSLTEGCPILSSVSLGQSAPVQELPSTPPIEPEALDQDCHKINPQALALVAPPLSNSNRVKAVRTLTGHSTDAVKAILAHYDTDHPKNLTPEQCDELIEILVSYWYQDLKLASQFPSSDWRSSIQHLQQQGLSEAAAISNWMSQLTSSPTKLLRASHLQL